MNPFNQPTEQEKPSFDPALHDRIMQSVQQSRIDGLIQKQPFPLQQHHPLRYATAIAAVLVLGLSVYFFNQSLNPSHQAQAAQFVPLIASLKESTDPINQQFTQPIQKATRQMTLLREDAQDLGRFIQGQFDVLPNENRTLNKSL